jgi:hypothetical protein
LGYVVRAANADKQLAVMAVSMDEPTSLESVKSVLADRVTDEVSCFTSQLGGGTAAMEAFEIEGGALPHYKLYDRQGKLARTFGLDPSAEKQFTVEDIEAAVKELLGE